MGTQLMPTPDDQKRTTRQEQRHTGELVDALLARLPWLDHGTATLLAALALDLERTHLDIAALILFGSLARHEERPLGAVRASDADLLVLVNPIQAGASAQDTPTGPVHITLEQKLAIIHTIGEREYHHPESALPVQAIIARWDLEGWDTQFVANVAQDGLLLWSRRSLPPALAPVAARGAVLAHEREALSEAHGAVYFDETRLLRALGADDDELAALEDES